MIETLTKKVLNGGEITKDEALLLVCTELNALCDNAVKIREHFCGNAFDICSIINGKSGSCSENCKYCAQSAHYFADIKTYPLLDKTAFVKAAQTNDQNGVLRFSIVTSGKRLSDGEITQVCDSFKAIGKVCDISLCASMGLLTPAQFNMLKAAGVSRYHNNLETSRQYFPHICTTHTYDDKIQAILDAQKAGLYVCSGGIMGLGETMEDRIDMALTLRSLHIRSVPLNILNPIPGTPLENQTPLQIDEIRRITAIYRFILPDSLIRLAGGRSLMKDGGRSVFLSGANGAITQNMLTTEGISVNEDRHLVKALGFEVRHYE